MGGIPPGHRAQRGALPRAQARCLLSRGDGGLQETSVSLQCFLQERGGPPRPPGASWDVRVPPGAPRGLLAINISAYYV